MSPSPSLQNCVLDTTLLGHEGVVSCSFFLSLQPLTLLTLSEDRTFKVWMCAYVCHCACPFTQAWNLRDSSLLYQSHIISSSPFLCGAVNVQSQHLATGTEDGMVCAPMGNSLDDVVAAATSVGPEGRGWIQVPAQVQCQQRAAEA